MIRAREKPGSSLLFPFVFIAMIMPAVTDR